MKVHRHEMWIGNVLFYRRRAMDVLCRCCNGVEAIQFKVEVVREGEPLLPHHHRKLHHRHCNQRVPHHDHESTRGWLRNDSQAYYNSRYQCGMLPQPLLLAVWFLLVSVQVCFRGVSNLTTILFNLFLSLQHVCTILSSLQHVCISKFSYDTD